MTLGFYFWLSLLSVEMVQTKRAGGAAVEGEGTMGHMQQSGAQRQISWLDWFSVSVLQLELVQQLQMRQIKGPWWQLDAGALCGGSRWIASDKLICPWCPWNRPAYILCSEEPLSIWCPAAEPHKDLKPFTTYFQPLAQVTFGGC